MVPVCTFPYSLVTVGGSGLGLMAIPAENVGALLLLGTTLTLGEISMKIGEAFTFVGEALIPAYSPVHRLSLLHFRTQSLA